LYTGTMIDSSSGDSGGCAAASGVGLKQWDYGRV